MEGSLEVRRCSSVLKSPPLASYLQTGTGHLTASHETLNADQHPQDVRGCVRSPMYAGGGGA